MARSRGSRALAEAIRESQQRRSTPEGEKPKGIEGHIANLERSFVQFEQREADRVFKQRREQAREEIVESLRTRGEEFPFVVALGLEETVADMIENEARNGRELTEDEAAKQIEELVSSRKEALAKIPALRELVQPGSADGGKKDDKSKPKDGEEGKKTGSESAEGQASGETLDNGLQSESQDSQGDDEIEDDETAFARMIEVLSGTGS